MESVLDDNVNILYQHYLNLQRIYSSIIPKLTQQIYPTLHDDQNNDNKNNDNNSKSGM